jgi:hypothetical protein
MKDGKFVSKIRVNRTFCLVFVVRGSKIISLSQFRVIGFQYELLTSPPLSLKFYNVLWSLVLCDVLRNNI